MSYKVVYSSAAKRDIRAVYRYIAEILRVPRTAKRQTIRITDTIDTLNLMPYRHRIYEIEPWKTEEMRILPIDNYAVFYKVFEERKIVKIIRIMYGSRNLPEYL